MVRLAQVAHGGGQARGCRHLAGLFRSQQQVHNQVGAAAADGTLQHRGGHCERWEEVGVAVCVRAAQQVGNEAGEWACAQAIDRQNELSDTRWAAKADTDVEHRQGQQKAAVTAPPQACLAVRQASRLAATAGGRRAPHQKSVQVEKEVASRAAGRVSRTGWAQRWHQW